jgi:hypothetical protein
MTPENYIVTPLLHQTMLVLMFYLSSPRFATSTTTMTGCRHSLVMSLILTEMEHNWCEHTLLHLKSPL